MEAMETTEPIPTSPDRDRLPRRALLERLGWGGLTALLLASGPGLVRFLRPRAGAGAGTLLEAGALQDYVDPGVTTRWVARHGVWIVNEDGRLFALEARCTHLGCTPRWEPERGMFQCPCHGSRFTPRGEVLNGPAVRALSRFAIAAEHDQVQVDLSTRAPMERAERDARFYVAV
jgi:cytochrome b6-f complex iron-sulfur subunit